MASTGAAPSGKDEIRRYEVGAVQRSAAPKVTSRRSLAGASVSVRQPTRWVERIDGPPSAAPDVLP